MDGPHRKLVRHHESSHQFRELTFSCYQRRPLLLDDVLRGMLSTSITRALEGHRWGLICFVFMPEHLHLIVFPEAPDPDVSALLSAIKMPFSFRAKRLLQARNDPALGTLTVRERPGKTAFRFWQEGPGFDRNIESMENLAECINYIHNNPVRRGLCANPADWKWSSVRFHPTGMVEKDLPSLSRLPQ